jgi:hypothetical protein
MDNIQSDDDETVEHDETASHSGTVILLLAGGGLAVAGVALEVVPEFAHQYAWIVNGFAKHGVTGMPLALCGLIFLGLCVVSRARDKFIRGAGPPGLASHARRRGAGRIRLRSRHGCPTRHRFEF